MMMSQPQAEASHFDIPELHADDYVNGWTARNRFGVTSYRLLQGAVRGQIRTMILNCGTILFSLTDARRYMERGDRP